MQFLTTKWPVLGLLLLMLAGRAQGESPARVLEGEDPEGGGEFNAEELEQELSKGIIEEVPKTFACEDAEKKITCTDSALSYLKFRITYKVEGVATGGPKKKVLYTITVSNALTEGQDNHAFHGSYRMKFTKDDKGLNLKQKMAWMFSPTSNDLTRPNYLNDLRRLVPVDMKSIKLNPKVNQLVQAVVTAPKIVKSDDSMVASGSCAGLVHDSCSLSFYATDASYMRIALTVGLYSSNYALPRSNFDEVFPVYAAAILRDYNKQISVQTANGFPLKPDMAKSLMVSAMSTVPGYTDGTEINAGASSYNLFSRSFVHSHLDGKQKRVDDKYSLVGVYYHFNNVVFEHVLLDSEKQQEELMLNCNSGQFQPLFQREFANFIASNDYSNVRTNNGEALTIEDFKTKMTKLVDKCTIADGADPATGFLVKCGETDVIAVTEINKETDAGFKVDFLVLVPNSGNVPDTGFVLPKVNSFDQVAKIAPAITAYVRNVQAHLAAKWALM